MTSDTVDVEYVIEAGLVCNFCILGTGHYSSHYSLQGAALGFSFTTIGGHSKCRAQGLEF